MGGRCHTGTHSSCTGVSMKVDPHNDVQAVRPLDQAVVSHTSAPASAKGVDELADLFSQEVGLNSQELMKRKVEVRVPPTEQFLQLYDQLGYPARATLASVSLRIRMQLLRRPSVEKLLALAGGDPACAYVVLKHVEAQADSEVRQPEAALARDAIARLEVRFKGQIQAGLNIAVALQGAGVDPQERQALRVLYYASVAPRQSLTTMMQALLGVYGSERLHIGLNAMSKALADNLAVLETSMPTPLLRTLLLGLQSCKQLSTVLAGCSEVIKRLGIEHDAVGLLQRVLAYAGSGIETTEALRLGNDLGGGQSQKQLGALQVLYPLFQQLPLAWWSDSQVRRETLSRLVIVVDELDRHLRGPTRFAGEPRTMT
ncbi:type III secretion protein W [Pseudomonas grimontii]|uniref:Type III secretion protein W n=2 Tax=Pseudomonas grimontii TaxID=129847 RepID=A0ABY0TWV3_9PSED|nr:type III secretion protein W [Pseudomonas grimontii]